MPTRPEAMPRSLRAPRDALVRTFVLLPDADVVADVNQFSRALFLKPGQDACGLALHRENHGEGAFAAAPTHAGQVDHCRARFKDDGLEPRPAIASCTLAMRARYVASVVSVVCCTAGSYAERLVDGLALFGEHAGAVVGDVHAILQAHSEFAVDRDGRFVAEAHARLEARLVAAHQVRPFMAVQTDSVAGAMRQAWHFVTGAETGIGDHLARGGVHGFAGRAPACAAASAASCALRSRFQISRWRAVGLPKTTVRVMSD